MEYPPWWSILHSGPLRSNPTVWQIRAYVVTAQYSTYLGTQCGSAEIHSCGVSVAVDPVLLYILIVHPMLQCGPPVDSVRRYGPHSRFNSRVWPSQLILSHGVTLRSNLTVRCDPLGRSNPAKWSSQHILFCGGPSSRSYPRGDPPSSSILRCDPPSRSYSAVWPSQ